MNNEKEVKDIANTLYKAATKQLLDKFKIPDGEADQENKIATKFTTEYRKKLCIDKIVEKLKEDPVRIFYYDNLIQSKKEKELKPFDCQALFNSRIIPFKERLKYQETEKTKVYVVQGQIVDNKSNPPAP